MPFLKKNASHGEKREEGVAGPSTATDNPVAHQKVTFIAVFLGVVASIGGFMFGYVRYALTTNYTQPRQAKPRRQLTNQYASTVVRFPVSSR